MATLYEYYNTGDDNDSTIQSVIWKVQTFTPSIAHTITSVKLKLWRYGSPGTFTVSIRATAGGAPTGADLCSGSIDGNTFTTDSAGLWYEITLGAGYVLTAGTKYAIVTRALNGSSYNIVRWRFDTSAPTYAGGEDWNSTNSGGSWGGPGTSDFMFEEWGDSLAAAPSVTTQATTDVTATTATGNGNITSTGGEAVTQHGHCWGTSANPTIADSKTQNGAGSVGAFTSPITGLIPETLYHTRAYATNTVGTSYGADVTFTTLPTVVTPTTLALAITTYAPGISLGTVIVGGGGGAGGAGEGGALTLAITTYAPGISLGTVIVGGTLTGTATALVITTYAPFAGLLRRLTLKSTLSTGLTITSILKGGG